MDLAECAYKCKETKDCVFFIHGQDGSDKEGMCHKQLLQTGYSYCEGYNERWKYEPYNFYMLKEAEEAAKKKAEEEAAKKKAEEEDAKKKAEEEATKKKAEEEAAKKKSEEEAV